MVYTSPVKAVMVLLAIVLEWPGFSHAADTIYPLISYKCDPDADVLTITNSLLKDGRGADFEYSAQSGTYSPWDMVEIARQTDSTRIIKANKVNNICQLSSGEYTVILEPQIFSKNLNGNCGATISGAVTIVLGGFDLLERTAFENYCHGNAPIITRITVFGKTGEYNIKRVAKYKFY